MHPYLVQVILPIHHIHTDSELICSFRVLGCSITVARADLCTKSPSACEEKLLESGGRIAGRQGFMGVAVNGRGSHH